MDCRPVSRLLQHHNVSPGVLGPLEPGSIRSQMDELSKQAVALSAEPLKPLIDERYVRPCEFFAQAGEEADVVEVLVKVLRSADANSVGYIHYHIRV